MYDHDHDHGFGHWHDHEDEGHRLSLSGLRRPALKLLGLAIVATIAWRTVFFVDETQYVYVTQFGSPVRMCLEPGLQWKWFYQSLWKFDRRLRLYEPPAREMLTEDKENLNVTWYVCWRIPSPDFAAETGSTDSTAASEETQRLVRRFLQTVGSAEAAENRLEERIQALVAAELGRTRLSQLVSLDPGQVELEALTDRISNAIRRAAREQFGIEVVDVRIKRLNYPESVKPAVFAEIRSERERVAVQYRAEGASRKTRIESQADLERSQILAQAQAEATRIRGEGEAKAIELLNAAHGQDPQFYELLKTLETYRTIIDQQTTVILSTDAPLLKLLSTGLPPLEAVEPGKPTSAPPGPAAARAARDASTPADRGAATP